MEDKLIADPKFYVEVQKLKLLFAAAGLFCMLTFPTDFRLLVLGF